MTHARISRWLVAAAALCGLLWVFFHDRPAPFVEWDIPTDPFEKQAYNFAHSIKLPDSVPKPVPFKFSQYVLASHRRTAAAYFEHLCRTEAGEYIFKKVEKVEGIYQRRAMPKRSQKLMWDRYGFEDPADWSQGEADGSPFLFIGGPGNGFRYFESSRRPEDIANRYTVQKWAVTQWKMPGAAPYWHYHDFDYTVGSGQVIPVETPESRYAYTWRGIQRVRDREFGIAGGELIVLDRMTGEILGARRSFAIAHQYPDHLDWEFANFCPKNLVVRSSGRHAEMNKVSYPHDFVSQVLDPVDLEPSQMRSN